MTSKEMRESPLFMRNGFEPVGKWGIPLIRKQPLIASDIRMIASSNTRTHEREDNLDCGVYFMVDDYRFTGVYHNPKRTLKKYTQYAFLLSPDFSLYADMNLWRQMESVAWNRWCGAYWQENDLTVYATISWSTARSYEFCFDGVEQNAVVAVGMNGCKSHNKPNFMRGYDAMLERLQPEAILCIGNPFPEMRGNIIRVAYEEKRKSIKRKAAH